MAAPVAQPPRVFERIDVERVDVVGREIARHRVEPGLHRPAGDRKEREQPFGDGAIESRHVAVAACRAPEIPEALARLRRPAAGEAVGHHHRIERAGGRAGNSLDFDPPVLQQFVEHAPSERAMRAAAQQREVDALFAGGGLGLAVAAEGA
ncbi:MAG: hypothetical protein EXQ83_14810 [Xanthobacteraceae bacterium]|nr:hypothetical protein [Xanthobacteraceae bacterium]